MREQYGGMFGLPERRNDRCRQDSGRLQTDKEKKEERHANAANRKATACCGETCPTAPQRAHSDAGAENEDANFVEAGLSCWLCHTSSVCQALTNFKSVIGYRPLR